MLTFFFVVLYETCPAYNHIHNALKRRGPPEDFMLPRGQLGEDVYNSLNIGIRPAIIVGGNLGHVLSARINQTDWLRQ